MKDDFFFLHQSFDQDTPPAEIILIQTDPFFDGKLKSLLEEKLNFSVENYCSFADCWENLILKTTPFCLISGSSPTETTDTTAIIKKLKKESPHFTGIILQKSPIEASAMVEEGIHYLTTPFSFEKLFSSILQALQEDRGIILQQDKEKFTQINFSKNIFQGMSGQSNIMQEIFENTKKTSEKDCPVLITGSPGTGKKLLARAIHRLSPLKNKTSLLVDSGKIPFDLLTSLLLKEGTVILNNIHQMPLITQRKLLHFLNQTKSRDFDGCRIIATSNELNSNYDTKRFSDDLYHFFKLFFKLPSLEKRKEDILFLLSLFSARYSLGGDRLTFDDDALQILQRYSWAYNIQELAEFVEEMVYIKKEGNVSAADLPTKYSLALQMTIPKEGFVLKNIINTIELSLIDQALLKTKGNKQRASKLLGIKRTTLIEKMKKRKMQQQNERRL